MKLSYSGGIISEEGIYRVSATTNTGTSMTAPEERLMDLMR
jgi:hypothetical protein